MQEEGLLKVRCKKKETFELWRSLLKLYKKDGKLAEDLLLDSLKEVAAKRLKPELY